MTKLWHKYALALSLAAILPLAIAAWQIAARGAEEVNESARAYHIAVGDTATGVVRTLVDSAIADAETIAATIALASLPAEERLRLAQTQLIGSRYLDNFSVYTPDGVAIQHMDAADQGGDVAARVTPPATLSEALRTAAKKDGRAFDEVIRRDDGRLSLPLAVSVLKESGELYAYGWTAIDLDPLSQAFGEQSTRRFQVNDRVTLIDGQMRVIANGDRARLWQPFAAGDKLGMDQASDLKRDMAHSFEYAHPSGDVRRGVVAPVIDVGWGIVVEQPRDEVFAGVRNVWMMALVIGVAAAVLALLLGVVAGRRLSAPIEAVSEAAGKVAGGDFSVRVPVPGKDEVGRLANSFNAMTGQLTDTIAKLQETTAAKERMQTELDIGRDIQMSMVPLKFPAFPGRKDFDVHAALEPAFEVGGDFYDFFLIDDTTLCVCIADVSGKGVPAALFMAVTRTLVKTHAHGGLSTDEILEKVNDDLAKDNDACMFVTLFLALVDLKTGEMTFTNAGHNPSYIKRADGKTERLTQLHGPAIAAMEDIPYASGKARLGRGDTLILYTDGVNEAMNDKHELFTDERLAKLIETHTWTSSDGAVKTVLDDVWRFQGDADQADDVTVVALRYLGA